MGTTQTALIVTAVVSGALLGASIGSMAFLLGKFEEQVHGW